MKKKWYFGTLLTALAVFVVMQQQTVVPNQEVVLEFVNAEITSLEAERVITDVKKQLESIGVQHTRISKGLENGTLTIAYYSDADVESIKKMLSNAEQLTLDHTFYEQQEEENDQLPLEHTSKQYNIDVYEIQELVDIDADFNGVYVETFQKQEGDTQSNSTVFVMLVDTDIDTKQVAVASKLNMIIVSTIAIPSYTIPEVRAGPIA